MNTASQILEAKGYNSQMTREEFAKTVTIYKSHKLKNGFISVTYAYVLAPNTVSTAHTEEIEDKGGALTSLYREKVG